MAHCNNNRRSVQQSQLEDNMIHSHKSLHHSKRTAQKLAHHSTKKRLEMTVNLHLPDENIRRPTSCNS